MEIKTSEQFTEAEAMLNFFDKIYTFLVQEAQYASEVMKVDSHNIGAQNILMHSQQDMEMMLPIIVTLRQDIYAYAMTKEPRLKHLNNKKLKLEKNVKS